ncbi:MAG: hypothetical protein ED557_03235 [Balneola sp.]|nr:MAG: hypothetical protein ED557_03235 [Balneola sp.]
MKKLSPESFQRAKSFIFSKGRILDQRLFEFHFEHGNKDSVIEALEKFQNEDGGFGNALEPDLRSPLSTVYTTSQGLFLLRKIGASSKEAIVAKAIEYLLNSYIKERSIWPIIPSEALNSPHAGHWDEIIEKEFDSFFINMRAGLAGHFWHYSELIPDGFAEKITKNVMTTLLTTPDEKLGWIFDLWSYLGLMGTKNLPENHRNEILNKLRKVIPGKVEKNPEKWTMMSVSPLNMAPTPDSPIVSVIDPELIQQNLDYDIDQQLEDGIWALDWSWEQDDPEAWKVAEKEWKAHLAIGKLQTLQAYERIV